jgi:hypothetical protein
MKVYNHITMEYVRKLEDTLKEILELNPLRNDFDAYLFALCEYAIIGTKNKPKREDFGLKPTDR